MMKRNNIIKIMVFLGVISLALFSVMSIADAAITGTKHDFSAEGWNLTGEICVTCHTPHNADAGTAPLWNHASTSATFTPYASVTLDATIGQPDGVSVACLSCHDGTVALDSFGGNTGSTFMPLGDTNLGTDLANDHPVSFTFDTALSTADGELSDPSVISSGLGGTIAADMLFSDKIQCASCHDVHNSAGIDKFLRKSNAGSALCLTCHTK